MDREGEERKRKEQKSGRVEEWKSGKVVRNMYLNRRSTNRVFLQVLLEIRMLHHRGHNLHGKLEESGIPFFDHFSIKIYRSGSSHCNNLVAIFDGMKIWVPCLKRKDLIK
jgi:hypothetical protein